LGCVGSLVNSVQEDHLRFVDQSSPSRRPPVQGRQANATNQRRHFSWARRFRLYGNFGGSDTAGSLWIADFECTLLFFQLSNIGPSLISRCHALPSLPKPWGCKDACSDNKHEKIQNLRPDRSYLSDQLF